MATINYASPSILLKRGRHSWIKENSDIVNEYVLREGETFLEYQDQYAGKWYERFMAPVRVKYGDGHTVYPELPFINGILKPFAKMCLTISIISIIHIIMVITFLCIIL